MSVFNDFISEANLRNPPLLNAKFTWSNMRDAAIGQISLLCNIGGMFPKFANEVVEETKKNKNEGLVLKVKFEKAYDHIEWIFLYHILEQKGFGQRWRKWIGGCLQSAKFSIMINGRPRGKFNASRELRQGDPLSPFLFTLVVDVLSRLLEKAMEMKVIEGLVVRREKVEENLSDIEVEQLTLLLLLLEPKPSSGHFTSPKWYRRFALLRCPSGGGSGGGVGSELRWRIPPRVDRSSTFCRPVDRSAGATPKWERKREKGKEDLGF
ncbi:hypothetical protein M0R45_026633 [Rubus argutus]|uniref:Reverse transcriptase domain-containing protein n=1 Tax=Rubus argutus TaxID=59490 RepID=A0AAW1X1L4_RUBAR